MVLRSLNIRFDLLHALLCILYKPPIVLRCAHGNRKLQKHGPSPSVAPRDQLQGSTGFQSGPYEY